jgi:hypothetical protein
VWKATSDSAGSVFGVARQDSRADFFFFFFFCKETQGLEPTTHVLEVQHLRHLRQKNNFKKMYIFFFFLRGFFFQRAMSVPIVRRTALSAAATPKHIPLARRAHIIVHSGSARFARAEKAKPKCTLVNAKRKRAK